MINRLASNGLYGAQIRKSFVKLPADACREIYRYLQDEGHAIDLGNIYLTLIQILFGEIRNGRGFEKVPAKGEPK